MLQRGQESDDVSFGSSSDAELGIFGKGRYIRDGGGEGYGGNEGGCVKEAVSIAVPGVS